MIDLFYHQQATKVNHKVEGLRNCIAFKGREFASSSSLYGVFKENKLAAPHLKNCTSC